MKNEGRRTPFAVIHIAVKSFRSQLPPVDFFLEFKWIYW
jgi:hypothetical protein